MEMLSIRSVQVIAMILGILLPAQFHGDEILFDGFDFSMCFEDQANFKHLGNCDWMNSMYEKRVVAYYSYNNTAHKDVLIADLKEKSTYVSTFQDHVLKRR